MLCMVVGFVAIAVPVVIFLLSGADFTVFSVTVLVFVLIACAALWRWLKTSGSKKFYAI